jgi:hypothetical protein
VFAGLTYHLYNGYWFLLPLAFGWSLRRPAAAPTRRRLDPWWLLGGVTGFGLPLLVGTVFGGAHYWTVLRDFSGTVKQGLFAEGWSLPWEYLAHSESLLGYLLLGVIAGALLQFRGRVPDRVRSYLVLLAGAYGLMVLMSTGLGKFVLYARTARPLVPLFCVVGGWAVQEFTVHFPRRRLVALVVAGLALLNFAPHFLQTFPRDVEGRILATLGNPKAGLSVDGCIFRPLVLPVVRPELVLVNAQFLYPVRAYAGYPEGKVLLAIANPLGYVPYQYEGHTPRERRLLRENDITVKLIRLADPGAVPDHPPPDRLFTDADRPDGFDHGRR